MNDAYYLKRLFEFQVNPVEFLGFSVNVFLSNVLMMLFVYWLVLNGACYLKRLFEFQVNPAEFLGFSVNVFVFNVLMVLFVY